jgi:uncharacterized repeat protein (TIGR01451 family)
MRLKFKIILRALICMLFFLASLGNTAGQPTQVFPFCDNQWTCTANDVNVTSVYLTDVDLCSEPGDIVSATLRVVVCNAAAAARHCLYLNATLINITDGTSYEINQLIPDASVIPGKTCTEYDLKQITWEYGDELSLDVHLLSWDVNAPGGQDTCQDTLTCNDRPSSQCSKEYTLSVIPLVPGIGADKQANLNSATIGDIITYTYNVTNEGNVNLTGIQVTDSQGIALTFNGGDANGDGYLNLSEIWKYTATYKVTEGDVCEDITNTATVTADSVCPGGDPLSDTSDLVAITTYYDAAIMVEKQADLDFAAVGDVVTYTYNVTNEGDVNLTGIAISDSRGLIPVFDGGDLNNDGYLNLSEIWNYTATYKVTEEDICEDITNTATVTADPICVDDNEVTDTSDPVTVQTDYDAAISIDKKANRASATVGDIITYTYNVTNEGNINITGIQVMDSRGLAMTFDGGDLNNDGYLNLSEIWNYTATYKVTEDDLCEDITNTATVTADPVCIDDSEVTDTSDLVTVQIDYDAAIMVEKQADLTSATVGDVITYTYNVTNEGNVNLTGIALSDSRGLIPAFDGGDTDGNGYLNLSEIWNYTATYTVTEDDICEDITNTATATAYPVCPDGDPLSDTSDPVTVQTDYDAAIMVEKQADLTSATVGDVITYTYNVTNEGNINLTGIDVLDSRDLALIFNGGDANGDGYLNLSEIWNYTATYKVTEEDICEDITNTATAAADPVCIDDSEVTDTSDLVTVQTDYDAAIMVEKQADLTSATVGDIITYTYNVTNEGNINLTGIALSDSRGFIPVFDGGDLNNDGYLNLSEIWNYTAIYKVTEEDICEDITNTATVTADSICPDGDPLSDTSDPVTVETTYEAAIMIEKRADLTLATVGDVITYTYNLTNGGNVNLTGIQVTDSRGLIPVFDGGDLNNDNYLNLSEIWNYTATYKVTEGDICEDITNTATATADPICIDDGEVTDTSDPVTVETTYKAAIKIEKSADLPSATVGDLINYTYEVTNTGSVNLSDVEVKDDRLGPIEGEM